MRTYQEYMDSPLPWLRKVPSHWELFRNKNIFQEVKDTVGEDASAYPLLSLTTKGIILRDVESGKGKFPKDFNTYKVVSKGDMAFCLFDIDETPRTVGLSSYNGMLTGAYTIFHVNNINPRYVYYYYLSLDNVKALRPLYSGLRKTINVGTFLGTKLPVPPSTEQDQIVRFLDWKVSNINKLINIQKKQVRVIEELKEKVVCEALLHGIDAGISYKDSGIAWIGSIPAHWKVIKIKWLFDEADERNTDETAELLTFSKKRGLIPFSEASEKMPSASDLSNYKLLHIGQLLENRMQAWHGMFICADREGCVSPDYSVFSASKEREVNVKFYEYAFRSHIWVEQFANASRGVGSGFNRLYTPQFGAIYTVYPEINEQNRIVEYLDSKMAQLNALIEQIEERIEGLEELKTTLISDVVTGKIDVRDVEILEYEFVDEDADADSDSDDDSDDTEE